MLQNVWLLDYINSLFIKSNFVRAIYKIAKLSDYAPYKVILQS